MIVFKGQGATASELPIGLAGARTYFEDVTAFLNKIEAVQAVKPLARPGAFLVTHHPVGGLGYMVAMAACLQAEWDEGGMRLVPLDFDMAQVKSEHPVVKGFIEAALALEPRAGDRTGVDFGFDLSVEVPLPGALRMLPRGLVQVTGDGIMSAQVRLVVQSLFRKVMEDFRLGAEATG